MKQALNKRWLYFVTAGAVAVAVIAGYTLWSSRAKVEEFMTAKVERGDIRNTVSATGTLQAVTTVQVGSQVSGTIQALYADFNSEVKKGQVIAQLDPAIFQAQVKQARANLKQARADLTDANARLSAAKATVENLRAGVSSASANVAALKAQLDDAASLLKRQEELAERGIISQREFELARTSHQAAQARYNQASAQLDQARVSEQSSASAGLEQAQAQVELAEARVEQTSAALELSEVNLSHTTIRSPIDGVVVLRNVDVGQTVAASLQAPTLFTIANDLTQMQVIANIDEADVGMINTNNRVNFTVDAFPGKGFRGTINQLRLNPQTVQNVVTYNVVIDVKNPDLKLKPGMTANLTFYIAERKNALKVPNSALRFSPQGQTRKQIREALPEAERSSDFVSATDPVLEGQMRIFWAPGPDKKPSPRLIKIGITDGAATEVIEGSLQEGEIVIVGQTVSGQSQSQSSQSAPGFRNAPGGPGGGMRPR
jgi:HlyD family secretion protein